MHAPRARACQGRRTEGVERGNYPATSRKGERSGDVIQQNSRTAEKAGAEF